MSWSVSVNKGKAMRKEEAFGPTEVCELGDDAGQKGVAAEAQLRAAKMAAKAILNNVPYEHVIVSLSGHVAAPGEKGSSIGVNIYDVAPAAAESQTEDPNKE